MLNHFDIIYIIDVEKQKTIYMTLAQIDGTLLGLIIAGYGFIETSRMENLHGEFKKRVSLKNFWIFLTIVLLGISSIVFFIWCFASVENSYDKLFDIMSNEAMIIFLMLLISLILYVYFMSPYYLEKIINEDIYYLEKKDEERKKEDEENKKDVIEYKEDANDRKNDVSSESKKDRYIRNYEDLVLKGRLLAYNNKIYGNLDIKDIYRLPIEMIWKSLSEKNLINNYCCYMFDDIKVYYEILTNSRSFDLVRDEQINNLETINYYMKKIIDDENKNEPITLLNTYCSEYALNGLAEKIVSYIEDSKKNVDELYNEFSSEEQKKIDRTLNKLIKFKILKMESKNYFLIK